MKTKCGPLEEKLANILDTYNGEFAIQSFNPFSINWFRQNRPNVLIGQLSSKMKRGNIIKRFVLEKMLLNFMTKPDFISYCVNDLSFEKTRKIRKNKLLLGWTVRTEDQKEKFINEYDNLICENIL